MLGCTFVSLNDNNLNIRHAATKLTTAPTLSDPASGSDSDSAACAAEAPPNRALVPAGQEPHGRAEQEAATARGVAPRGEARPREPPRVRSRPAPRSHATVTAELCAARRCRALGMRVAHRR
jgi:hypothetical protein